MTSSPATASTANGLSPMRRLLPPWRRRGPVVPVLRFAGTIGSVTPLRPGITLTSSAQSIERAFAMAGASAVAVQINSPGGSPVQSTLIYNRIRQLAKEKSLPVYVFGEDVMASGGYLLALAGDEIYADASSIVGSIGVVSASFGFHELMQKIGVDRRVYTAGARKMILDPFQPEKDEDVRHLKSIQENVHETFVGLVKERRGAKIEAHLDRLFDGAFWSGRQSVELGLIDGVADLRTKMREKFGDEVRFKLVSPERSLFRRRVPGVGGSDDFGLGLAAPTWAEDLVSALEARALWSRFGF